MRVGFMTLYRSRLTAARLRFFCAAALARVGIYSLYAQVRAPPYTSIDSNLNDF